MRAYGGHVLALDRHLSRLEGSVKGSGKRLKWPAADTARWVDACLTRSRYRDALLRLMVVFGGEAGDAMVLFIRRFAPYPPEVYAKGISVRTSTQLKTSMRAGNPQIKSNQYVGAVMSFLETASGPQPAAPGSFETLFLNAQGFLTEGTVSNIVTLKGTQLVTPGAPAGILRGVTREIVFEAAARLGFSFAETQLTRHDLYNADEAFITTTLSEIMPVVSCDGRKIGSGRPGEGARRIHAEFRRLVAEKYLNLDLKHKTKTRKK